MKRVLIVDDDVELCELVTEYLKREGLQADSVHAGEEGVERAQNGDYAVVVLDVMLPGIGGFEVLRRLRSGPSSQLPVVMLTARGDEVDRVLGLELGADDYLPKPFSSRELVARIRAILRRTVAPNTIAPNATAPNAAAPNVAAPNVAAPNVAAPNVAAPMRSAHERLVVGDVEMDIGARAVFRGGAPVELTAMEFRLLELLLRQAGDVVSREEISHRVLDRPLLSYDRSLDIHISNLRRKLGSAQGEDLIKTVRGVGYVYVQSGTKTSAQ